MFLVDITEVATHDPDDPIVLFAKGLAPPHAARDWWYAHQAAMDKITDPSTLDGFEEMQRDFLARLPLDVRLAGLKPEDVLPRFKPEDRLSGLKPEDVLPRFKPAEIAHALKPEDRLLDLTPAQAVLALPLELLRALPESYIATLPDDVQRTVRDRLTR